ncbi:MAG TPA: carbon monoxide dehydrogenase subunit G [Dongiaceae bacterium]|nr:carbon monoxide dehydrogenase subunit G [Dongiaceae bacterium]
MDMTGEHQINAPRAGVWAALNDPEVLKQSIAGCEELAKVSDTEFQAQVTAKVGPVKAKFNGKVTLSDLDPPNGYTITGEGQGGAAGFAKGGAKVHLEDAAAGGTLLKYEVHAQIGGKLAQIGSRLIDGAARKMADDFFSAFAAAVEARTVKAMPQPDDGVLPGVEAEPAAAPAATPVPGGAPVAEPAASASGKSGLPPAVWIGGLIVVIGAGLWWFLRK